VAANPNLNYDDVYDNLLYQKTKGGNADFAYTGDITDLNFLPNYDTGGGMWSRYGSTPSIHLDDGFAHLDTANPEWAVPVGFLGHVFFDVLLGHINPGVPMVHI
jgi:hypothetical protein